MNPKQTIDLYILALCIWREARGESLDAKQGVGSVILNRVKHPGWWGNNVLSVITSRYQFSSFNLNDANEDKWPLNDDVSWLDSFSVASKLLSGSLIDNTGGCTLYYDKSLDMKPPAWALAPTTVKGPVIGSLRFFKS